MSSLKLISLIAKEKKKQMEGKIRGLFNKKPEKILTNLPMGFHDNSLVNIDEISFVLGEGNLLFQPTVAENQLAAIGKYIIEDQDIYRMYLRGRDNENDCFVEVAEDDGEILQCITWYEAFEVNPDTGDEWDFWSGNDGLIGYETFQIHKGMEDVNGFVVPKDAIYGRVWDQDGPEQVKPWLIKEMIYNDSFDTHPKLMQYKCMLYGRLVAVGVIELSEYVLPNHVRMPDGTEYISIWLGLSMNPAEIEII